MRFFHWCLLDPHCRSFDCPPRIYIAVSRWFVFFNPIDWRDHGAGPRPRRAVRGDQRCGRPQHGGCAVGVRRPARLSIPRRRTPGALLLGVLLLCGR